MEEKQTQSDEKKDSIETILDFLKDTNSKELQKAVIKLLNRAVPSPFLKLIRDVAISGVCLLTIIYCANNGIIEKSNSPQLITLVIGAIIGARFKS